jgi:HSF-type DNA-binding
LEGETLPKYFRHNRFQSLVRQLNFYSFRKINRERNVWIYKHHLFRRDFPKDLHLVRRRTCPGLDGRKQRFSRIGQRKTTSQFDNVEAKNDDDSMSDEVDQSPSGSDSIVDELSTSVTSENSPDDFGQCFDLYEGYRCRDNIVHNIIDTSHQLLSMKIPTTINATHISENVDTSLLESIDTVEHAKYVEVDENESVFCDTEDANIEGVTQSDVVSEVAFKLEQFAKKANVRLGPRTRRFGTGVVTPPFSTSSKSSIGIISYDDEIIFGNDDTGSDRSSSVYLTPSKTIDFRECGSISYSKRDPVVKPVSDCRTVDVIVQRILLSAKDGFRGSTVAPASVAGFCMSNVPAIDSGIAKKILSLLSSCPAVANEFHLYQSALHPSQAFKKRVTTPYTSFWGGKYDYTDHGEGNRNTLVRDFAIFSINCIEKLVGKLESDGIHKSQLSPSDKKILEGTMEMWQKSIGTYVQYQ